MKAGRVIGGDEHDARTKAEQILSDARAEAERLKHDAAQLAEQLVRSARAESERRDASALDAELSRTHGELLALGSVDEVVGLVVRATVPGVALGEVVKIDRRDRGPAAAEVVGFSGEQAVLLPLGDLAGVAAASSVWRTGAPLAIACGDDLLGRVLDGTGAAIDGGPALTGESWPVDRAAPRPT